MLTRIAELWCKTMHGQAMWPIHGRYICPRCLRQWDVEWESSGFHDRNDTPHRAPTARERSVATELSQAL